MSRKHYRILAEAIRHVASEYDRRNLFEVSARLFQEGNPRFDREIYREACGVALEYPKEG